MSDKTEKASVLEEISHLISVDGSQTEINPNVLEFLDLKELYNIRDNLTKKKETVVEDNLEWLEQFKKE